MIKPIDVCDELEHEGVWWDREGSLTGRRTAGMGEARGRPHRRLRQRALVRREAEGTVTKMALGNPQIRRQVEALAPGHSVEGTQDRVGARNSVDKCPDNAAPRSRCSTIRFL